MGGGVYQNQKYKSKEKSKKDSEDIKEGINPSLRI